MKKPTQSYSKEGLSRSARWWNHIAAELPSSIFVAAVITVIHLNTSLLSAIDSYVFLTVANLSAYREYAEQKNSKDVGTNYDKYPNITVLSIDQNTYDASYAEMSPLNRCKLLNDIKLIYDASPKLLVIDLDISPAKWLGKPCNLENAMACRPCDNGETDRTQACQLACQQQLYQLIRATNNKIKTVLMLPFGTAVGPPWNNEKTFWMPSMNGVAFGSAKLNIKFGLVLDADIGRASLAGKACEELDSHYRKGICLTSESTSKRETINPQIYLHRLSNVKLSELLNHENSADKKINGQVVFFGGKWGEDDTYLTPIGELFGVDIHAAAFLSSADHFKEINWLGFVVDIGIALLFGLVISYCWARYFKLRFSSDASQRQRAPLWIVMLTAIFILLALPVAIAVSWFLMTCGSIWASPLPLAIGMLIESFASGSVSQANRESFHLSHRPAPQVKGLLESIKRTVRDVTNLWTKVDRFDKELGILKSQRWKVDLEINKLERSGVSNVKGKYHWAAFWLASRRLIWAVTVLYCVVMITRR